MRITTRIITNPSEFTGKLKRKLKMRYNHFHNLEVKAGVLNGETYPTGESVASVAQQLEYGGITEEGHLIPPRPFMRQSVRNNKDKWIAQIKDDLSNGVRFEKTAARLGETMANDIRETIKDGEQFTPLAPMTVALRKARGNMDTTPLNDTGILRSSITSEVEG